MNNIKTLNKVTKNTFALVLFLLSSNIYAQYDFSEFYQIDSNSGGGIILDSLSNMLLLNDEFEQSYIIYPKKDFLDSINASKQLKWFTMTAMSRESKGYALILSLQLALAPNSDFVEEDNEFIVIVDEDRPRMSYNLQIGKNDSAIISIRTTDINEWGKIANSNSAKFRINGEVYEIDNDAKVMMQDVHSVVNQIIEKEFPKEEQKEELEDDFFVVVEQMPSLKGGLSDLQKKVRYPEMARRAGIEGRVTVQFIVGIDGSIENPRVIRGIGGGCDEEAIRVVQSAKFTPGMQRGRPVRVQYSLPIVFRL